MRNKIIEIISKTTKLEKKFIRENSSKQIWDSLKHFEIIILLEDAFNVRLDTADIAAMRSVDEIINILQRIHDNK